MSAPLTIGTRSDGKPFTVPLSVVTQRNAFLGRPGSGKSYGASKIVEEMIGAGAQVVVLDPVGVWWGLRLAKDGKAPGLAVPVFGGLHGDIPLEPTAGALVADLVVDRGISVVLDVSQFEHDTQKAKFAADFGARLFFRRKAAPSAMHVVLEECQEFVPENPQKGEERMLHAYTRMTKLGRNFGIGISLVTQRPQEVNKKALNLTECLFAFQMTGPHEKKTVKDWTDFHGTGQDIRELLPTLPIGSPFVSSPQWLQISEVVRIGEKWTFDASATPEVGKRAVARELAPIDLAKIQTEMAATLEKAKAEDPKELQRRIKELEAELRKKPAAAPDPAVVERALEDARVQREYNLKLHGQLGRAEALAKQLVAVFQNGSVPAAAPLPSPTPAAVHGPRTPAAPPPAARPERVAGPTAGGEGPPAMSDAQARILAGIALLQDIGVAAPSRPAVGAVSGYSSTSGGTFAKNIAILVEGGLVNIPAAGQVELTPAGARAATLGEPITSLAQLHAKWLGLLSEAEARILAALIAAYPDPLTRPQLGERTGYTSTSGGTFAKNVAKLVEMKAAWIPRAGLVQASDLLFPESLR